jgi:hypothetical protein
MQRILADSPLEIPSLHFVISVREKRDTADDACVRDRQERGLEHRIDRVEAGEGDSWQHKRGEASECCQREGAVTAGRLAGHEVIAGTMVIV